MSRAWLTLLTLAAAAASAPPAGAADAGADPRLRIVDYDPSTVLTLTGFVGYHVHFEFAPGEHFVNLGAGDTASIDVGAEGNHLLLKPRQPSSGTNLTILTNRRAYVVDYRALARAPRPAEATYSVVFRYPGADAGAVSAGAADAALGVPRPVRNANYWFCGSASLRPIAAVDDGVQLRLTFAARTPLPAIYAAALDGAETLVNTHVEDDVLVVHELLPRFVVRRGNEVGCIVDRSDQPAGHQRARGTVDGRIERTTREPTP